MLRSTVVLRYLGSSANRWRRVLNECDGMLVGTPPCYERPETLQAVSEWFSRSGREVYMIGPIVSTTEHARTTEKTQSAAAHEIDAFLTQILASHGPCSLLYVRNQLLLQTYLSRGL